MNDSQFLYHYTSLETLALILSNRTLRFNSLQYVDDMEEAEAADLKHFGKFVYVSCWTKEETESIPMWKMYTSDMHGVRIQLPQFPFKKYHYKKSEYGASADFDSYIDYHMLFEDDKMSVTPNFPELIDVGYTKDQELLFPKVRSGDDLLDYLDIVKGKPSAHTSSKSSYSFRNLGRYKREEWAFQKESRYWLFANPIGLSSQNTLEGHAQFAKNLEASDYVLPYKYIDFSLEESSIRKMKVLFGPKMTEAEKILAKALLQAKGLENCWSESTLRIR